MNMDMSSKVASRGLTLVTRNPLLFEEITDFQGDLIRFLVSIYKKGSWRLDFYDRSLPLSFYKEEEKIERLMPENVQKLIITKICTKLPDLTKLKNIDELWLQELHLTELPEDILSLTSLTSLYCIHNNLTSLPSLDTLCNLTVLNVDGNQLEELCEIGKLKNLERLSCKYNKLIKLPSLKGLINIRHICCSDNKIRELPSDIVELVGLEELICNHNLLKTLPDLTGFGRLRYFDCRYNYLNVDEILHAPNIHPLTWCIRFQNT